MSTAALVCKSAQLYQGILAYFELRKLSSLYYFNSSNANLDYKKYYMNLDILYFIQIQKYGIIYLSLNAWIEICIMYYKRWAYLLDKPFLIASSIRNMRSYLYLYIWYSTVIIKIYSIEFTICTGYNCVN